VKSFNQFITELSPYFAMLNTWDGTYSPHIGKHAEINKPDDEHHGKTGRILKQQGTTYGVEVEPNRMSWYNASHLKNIK
jgi:hypothetical protein